MKEKKRKWKCVSLALLCSTEASRDEAATITNVIFLFAFTLRFIVGRRWSGFLKRPNSEKEAVLFFPFCFCVFQGYKTSRLHHITSFFFSCEIKTCGQIKIASLLRFHSCKACNLSVDEIWASASVNCDHRITRYNAWYFENICSSISLIHWECWQRFSP